MSDNENDIQDDYNAMVISTGSWIDKEFVEEVMTSTFGEVNIEDHQIAAAVGAGDNYLSILYRVIVSYTTNDSDEVQTKNLMVKGLPTVAFLLDMIEDFGLFQKEISMHTECLPVMYKILQESFSEDADHVAPIAFICHRESTLVMEDLQVKGYKMAERQKQLDFDHCVVTLKNLAMFHALSVKLHELHPEMIEIVSGETYTEEHREKLGPILEQCFDLISQVISGWGEHAKYADDIHEIGKFIYDKMIEMVKPTEHLNVLVHGDLWSNNVMYKYDEDEHVIACKFVDFQLTRFSTPALDLLYFLFTSVQPDLLCDNMYELVDIYYEALTANLTTLGIEVDYPIERLHQDMRDRAAFAFVALVQFLPIAVSSPGGIDFEESEDENPYLTNYKYPYFAKVCGRLLDHMDRIGYIEDAKERWIDFVEAANSAKETREEETGVKAKIVATRPSSAHHEKMLRKMRGLVWRAYSEHLLSDMDE